MQHHLYLSADGVVGHWSARRVRASDSALVHLLTAAEAGSARRALPSSQPRPATRAIPVKEPV